MTRTAGFSNNGRRRAAVFCGSNAGVDPVHREAAATLGRLLAAHGVGVVYGGASIGLMGALADACLAAGGEVIGVIPRHLAVREVAHEGLQDLRVVETMHERKALMAGLSEAFIVLPGGFGTLEEMFEVITWRQLGLHDRPVTIINTGGYFDPLLAFLDRAVEEGFLRGAHRDLLDVVVDPAAAVVRFHSPTPATRDIDLRTT